MFVRSTQVGIAKTNTDRITMIKLSLMFFFIPNNDFSKNIVLFVYCVSHSDVY